MSEANGPAVETLAIHAGLAREARSASGVDWPGVIEERLAAIEGGTAAVAVNSGAAARLLALRTLCAPGDEIVVPHRLTWSSAAELASAYAPFGWRVKAVDVNDSGALAATVSPRTRAILIESLGDGGAAVTDLAAAADAAHRAGVPLIVDNTVATPALCRPLEFGADIVLHSTAEFIAGEPDAAGGAIVDGGVFDWRQEGRYPLLSEPQDALGGQSFCRRYGNFAFAMACKAAPTRMLGLAMPAEAARLAVVGLETLPLRMRRQSDTAAAIAERLAARSDLSWLDYPGLLGHRQHNLARRYLGDCAGTLLTAGCRDAARVERLLADTKLFVPGAPIGGRRSSMARLAASRNGAADAGAFRLYVGLESPGDLITDLEQAMAAAA
jgi:O-acetylhomoserine (thiol)-lyase